MTGRILIADDVATNRIILKVKLTNASYEVLQASSEAEFLHKANTVLPELIILDGGFQNGRGIDLCHTIKENPHTSAIPVLIIATDFTPAERLAALHAGAVDVLEKPIEKNGLLAKIRNTLRVRSVEEELHLREGTAQALGFHEAETPFPTPAQVLVINGAKSTDTRWQPAFEKENSCTLHVVDHSVALDVIARRNIAPDIVVMSAQLQAGKDCLFLLAELRNRRETRNAAIIIVNDSKNDAAAISALDIGANDVVCRDTPAAEFAFRLTRHLERKLKADKLRNTLKDGLQMAVTDPLTGLFNRRYALPHMSRIAEKSRLTGNPFAVMVLDLDHFKRINDTHGHGAGDLVLTEIAKRLKANVRNVDLLARIGGEEFLVALPDTDIESARITAERLRRVTEETPVWISTKVGSIKVTTSIGVSIGGLEGRKTATVETVVDRADQALLGAKSTGRNQVIFEKSAA